MEKVDTKARMVVSTKESSEEIDSMGTERLHIGTAAAMRAAGEED